MKFAISACCALLGLAGSVQASVFYGVTDSSLVTIDTSSQAVTTVGTLHTPASNLSLMADCEFDGSGNLVAMRQGSDFSGFPPAPLNQAFRVNTTNASVVQVSSFGTAFIFDAEAYSTTLGQMVSVDSNTGKLGTINYAASTFTPLYTVKHGLPGANRMDALAFSPSGTLYGVWNADTGLAGGFDYRLVQYDLSTGTAAMIGAIGTANVDRFTSLRFDASGTAYTVNSVTGTVETVNLTTGAGTALFSSSALIGTTGLAIQVPGPGVLGLFGLAGLVGVRRRR
jgi:hypothetical protein